MIKKAVVLFAQFGIDLEEGVKNNGRGPVMDRGRC